MPNREGGHIKGGANAKLLTSKENSHVLCGDLQLAHCTERARGCEI
jgi:hypothetical protein